MRLLPDINARKWSVYATGRIPECDRTNGGDRRFSRTGQSIGNLSVAWGVALVLQIRAGVLRKRYFCYNLSGIDSIHKECLGVIKVLISSCKLGIARGVCNPKGDVTFCNTGVPSRFALVWHTGIAPPLRLRCVVVQYQSAVPLVQTGR